MRKAGQKKPVRVKRSRLASECAKLDPKVEQSLAEEGMKRELAAWPEYIAEQQLKLAKEMRGILKGIDTTVEREPDRV